MQENCYRTFIKSDLYGQAVLAETEGRPFIYSGEPKAIMMREEVRITSEFIST